MENCGGAGGGASGGGPRLRGRSLDTCIGRSKCAASGIRAGFWLFDESPSSFHSFRGDGEGAAVLPAPC